MKDKIFGIAFCNNKTTGSYMLQPLRNIYLIIFLLLYAASVAVLVFVFHQPFSGILNPFLFFGLLFSFVAWMLLPNGDLSVSVRPSFKTETLIVIALVLYFTWYVTYGSSWMNKLIPRSITAIEWKNSIAVLFRKVFIFVLIPFLIYKAAGFSLKDFGLTSKIKDIFGKKTLWVFISLSLLVLLYQYFLSSGALPVKDGSFSIKQFLLGLPLLFAWLFIEVGLVEEFFFRAVLQSRISVLLRSPIAGIVVSGLIFGLAHAPGLYMRGAESEGISEQLPFIFWAAYTISAMSVAGIFLGIIWQRTKNLYLIMALHAMVDLLPNFAEFVHTWHL